MPSQDVGHAASDRIHRVLGGLTVSPSSAAPVGTPTPPTLRCRKPVPTTLQSRHQTCQQDRFCTITCGKRGTGCIASSSRFHCHSCRQEGQSREKVADARPLVGISIVPFYRAFSLLRLQMNEMWRDRILLNA